MRHSSSHSPTPLTVAARPKYWLAVATAALWAIDALAQSPKLPMPNPVPQASAHPAASGACPATLQHEFARLQDDTPQSLCQYAGKVILVVNTASYCGFTVQYEGLEALYAKYQNQGFVVLGFPSNNFGKQEPGSGKEIADFCFNTYGVKFPMFAKSEVVGPKRNLLYENLFAATRVAPSWNFHKYLIDRSGKPVASFSSNVPPDNVNIVTAIEKALNQKL